MCHICAALLVEGRVQQAGEVRDHGEFYTCIAEPLEDCIVLWDGVLAPGELPLRKLSCQLSECVDVGGDVWRVRLRCLWVELWACSFTVLIWIHLLSGENKLDQCSQKLFSLLRASQT